MDEKQFKERVSRLVKVGKVLEKLPTEVHAEAFNLLKSYVIADSTGASTKRPRSKPADQEGRKTQEEFFGDFDHDKPANNAYLIAAYIYSEYGSDPFSTQEVREIADDVGITLPTRPDNTYRNAKHKGKKLFNLAARGKFKPTVHGEAYLKATYSVRKGRKKHPRDES